MLKALLLYPELLNMYSDRGNVKVLQKRCSWRDIDLKIEEANIGAPLNFKGVDLVLLGSGGEGEQGLANKNLQRYKDDLAREVENGMVILATGSSHQMLGRHYHTTDGIKVDGLALLDFHTEPSDKRYIGDIIVEANIDGQLLQVIGFENHWGNTILNKTQAFGLVHRGFGNNGTDRREGARYKNVFCTYLHGPLLPKNPKLADYLILTALNRKGAGIKSLPPLDDSIEYQAREIILKR